MWSVITTHQFDTWLAGLNNSQQEKVLAGLLMIQHLGPSAGRPYVDTVKGSKYRDEKRFYVTQIHLADFLFGQYLSKR